jgi:DNA polymerase-3 subunit delta'
LERSEAAATGNAMSKETDPRDTPLHPRRRSFLIGRENAEERLQRAYRSGRLHHAWLIGGPRGIGKATLAYRFARFLLRYPHPEAAPHSLHVDPEDPVFRRTAAGAHPDLFVVERDFDPRTGRLKSETGVDVARLATGFFSRSAAEGGWRICIVDPADDLNLEAANALLKIVEEPPLRSIFLLVSHRPGALLRTIRSRCVRLNLAGLEQREVAEVLRSLPAEAIASTGDLQLAAELSGGSPGRALELLGSGGTRIFAEFHNLVANLPRLDRRQALTLAGKLQSRVAEEDFGIFCQLLVEWIAGKARSDSLSGRGGAHRWAGLHTELSHSIRQTNALNLDRRQLVMHAFEALQDAAGHSQS